MKNEQKQLFAKKLQAKEGAKIKLFMIKVSTNYNKPILSP